jgi:hypothetical protein
MNKARGYALQSSSGAKSSADRAPRLAFFLSAVALAFLAGAILQTAGVAPGPQIARAYIGAKAYYDKLTGYQDVYMSDLWYPAQRSDKGVTAYVPGAAQNGVVLYTSGSEPAAHLIDLQGNVLHTWRRPFSQVWHPSEDGVADPQPDPFVYIRNAHVYPNGDLLALYEGVGDTPYGYGVAKLDRESNLIWSYMGHAHHQLDVGPDGRIYVLTQEIVDDELERFAHLQRPRLEDFLVILSPDGEELQKIRLLPAVGESKFRHMGYTVSGFALGDPLHANAVTCITAEMAANFPFGKEGQVLLSFRELNGIAVLDVDTQTIVWATRGPWIGQHDPDILPNGHILLFDNYANYSGPEGASRVIEFDPKTMEIVWQYGGTADHPLESRIRGDQQRLPNGNTLITEASGGRMVEVTPGGEIAWEFVNPVRDPENGAKIAIIAWSQWLDPAGLDPSLLQPAQADRSTAEHAQSENHF